jgi:hypothetical protein
MDAINCDWCGKSVNERNAALQFVTQPKDMFLCGQCIDENMNDINNFF